MSSNDSDTDSIEKMYKNFGILADAKDKITEHEEEYIEIIDAVKGSAKEKRLASQFIARFFKHFPKLYDRAIDALLDLCEDEDVAIRKQAIKDLPALCKDTKQFTHRISDILAQLLQAEDSTELSVAHLSLMSILRNDPKGAFSGVFTQIMTGDDIVRERCIKFLVTKIKILGHDIVSKDVEDYVITEIKKVLQDVNADEFASFMDILGWTRLGQSLSGQQELVDLVADQANITQSFDPSDQENETVERLIQCLRHALPYFSSQVHSGRFVKYLCEEVLPKFSQFPAKEDLSELKLELLKIFAELSANCGTLDGVEKYVDKVFLQVIEYIPVQDVDSEIEPRLEFSHIECLLFAYHRLLKQCPETLTKDAEVLKDFRFRLQYLARAIQGYIKKLREALQGKSGDELKTDENKMKVVALKTTSNINTLIKDLFHTPPIFKSIISLSWKPAVPANSPASHAAARKSDVSPGSKRHTPITFDNGGSMPPAKATKQDYNKSNRELYQPPSGKYSNRVSSYVPSQRGGAGGRGRGRGNRRGRGWQNRFY